MTEWRIKEVSDMTKTSVRMLRHYDEIGLLVPSYRASNGYRYYTAQDLAKLQQIIALRYFGFNLSTIKTILKKHQNIYAHLQAQQQILKKESIHLQQVNDVLSNILQHLSPFETPNWHDLVTLIERYRMTENIREKLKNSWAGQELSESMFEEYLFMYEQFPAEFAMRDRIIEQINNNELGDPAGQDGERIVTFMMDLAMKMKTFYDHELKFGSSLLEGIKTGKLSRLELNPPGVNWLSRATVSFWLKRWERLYDGIMENISSDPAGEMGKKIADEWNGLIDEFFSMGPRSLAIGLILWQEIAKQNSQLNQELQENSMPSPQELVKQLHVKLLFNPEAITWISQALQIHTK